MHLSPRRWTQVLVTVLSLLAGLAWGQARLDTLSMLVQQVGTLKGEARLQAIGDLGRTGDPRALPPLFDVLRDTDPAARAAALQGLRGIRLPQVTAVIAAALQRESDAHARAEAVETLIIIADDANGWVKPADALPLLLAAALDTDPAVRGAAIDGLGKQTDARAIPAIQQALADKDADVRARAVQALGRIAPPDATGRVLELAHDTAPLVRAVVAAALGQLRDAKAIDTLCALTKDTDAHVRAAAAGALWYTADAPAAGAVTAALDDANAEVRAAAVGALGMMPSRPVGTKDALLARLNDDDALVRGAAAAALGHLRDAACVAPLLAALHTPKSWLGPSGVDCTGMVTNALVEIGVPAVPALLAARKDDKVGVRRQAVLALAQIGDMRAVPPLIDALEDEDAKVRQIAAHGLGQLGDGRAVPPLVKALRDRMPAVRWQIVDALAALNDAAANDALIAEMEKDDTEAGTHAAWALGVINAGKDGAVLAALAKAVQTVDGPKQLAVIWALGALGDLRAAPYLRAYLPALDPATQAPTAKEKRIAAILALGALGDKDSIPALLDIVPFMRDDPGQYDTDPDITIAAINALAALKATPAVLPLRMALNAPLYPPTMRWRALWALGEIGDPAAAGSLLSILQDTQRDPADRALAAEALGKMKYTGAADALLAASRENVPQVCLPALAALGNLPATADSTRRLLDAVQDARPAVRTLAAGLLGQRKTPEAIEMLGAMLHDDDPAARLTAIAALGRIGSERCVALLLPVAAGADASAAFTALLALGDTGDARASAPLLAAAAATDRGFARAQLLQALKKLPSPKEPLTTQPLLDALTGDDWRTRAAAAETLGAWRTPGAAEKLLPLLRDDTAAVRIAAYAALRAISGKDFGGDAAAWQQWLGAATVPK